MNSFDAAVANLLIKRIDEEIVLQTEALIHGSVEDYAAYKARAATLQTLENVKLWIEEAEYRVKF